MTNRRRRKSRRHSSRRLLQDDIDGEKSEFEASRLRSEVKASIEEARALSEYLSSSEAAKYSERMNDRSCLCDLFVGNLPYSATSISVVTALSKKLGIYRKGNPDYYLHFESVTNDNEVFPILKCHIPNPPQHGKSYFAFVTVSNQELKDDLKLMCSRELLVMDGRRLRINDPKKSNSYRTYNDYTAIRVSIKEVHAGFPLLQDLPEHEKRIYHRLYHFDDNSEVLKAPLSWNSCWQVPEEGQSRNIIMEINARKQTISFEFFQNFRKFRLECNLRYLQGKINFHSFKDGRESVLSVLLKLPPNIYQEDDTKIALMPNYTLNTFNYKYPIIIEGSQSNQLWQLGSENDKKWERIAKRGSSLGLCLQYRIVLQEKNIGKIISKLKNFNLISRKDERFNRIKVLRLNAEHGWSGDKESDEILDLLPSDIKYLIHCLVSQSRMNFAFCNKQIVTEFSALIRKNMKASLWALAQMDSHWIPSFYLNPVSVLRKWLGSYRLFEENEDIDEDDYQSIPIKCVSITPLRVVCHQPRLSSSNRMLRMFTNLNDRFLRVSFTDENLGSFYNAKSSNTIEHVSKCLQKGVEVSGKKFYFFAYSNSQLREQSCWMYHQKPENGVVVPSIAELRKLMGDFSQLQGKPSKFGARLGQCLSDTVDAIELFPCQWKIEEDINCNGYCFSDGVGRISTELMKKIAEKLNLAKIPSAIQVRFAGCKGVLSHYNMSPSTDPRVEVVFRKSMQKFLSDHRSIEVITTSRYIPTFLNRQIIVLLSGLGIKNDVFLSLQDKMITHLESMTVDNEDAIKFLSNFDSNEVGGSVKIATSMLRAGFTPITNSFLAGLLALFRERLFRDVVNRSKLLVEKAVTAIGVMDETGLLDPESIFVQFQRPSMSCPIILRGKVLVGRNPSLHLGDLRTLTAVDIPALRHLVNVIVFPQRGERPLPSMMSGGDLDGDIFFAIFDDSLIPSSSVTPNDPDTMIEKMEGIKSHDVTDWYSSYLLNDNLGLIGNAHLIHADYQTLGVKSEQCLKLADLYSVAVDFAKSGKPAPFPDTLKPPRAYPDFMQNKYHPSYESNGILGSLFRQAKFKNFRSTDVFNTVDDSLLLPGYEEFIDDAHMLRSCYEEELSKLMNQFGVSDEMEVVSGIFSEFYRSYEQKPKNSEQIIKSIALHYHRLKSEFRSDFFESLEDYFVEYDIRNEEKKEDARRRKASSWYASVFLEMGDQLKLHDSQVDRLISFAYIMYDILCEIKRSKPLDYRTGRLQDGLEAKFCQIF